MARKKKTTSDFLPDVPTTKSKYTTPSGGVAKKQRIKAVAQSPLKKQPGTKPANSKTAETVVTRKLTNAVGSTRETVRGGRVMKRELLNEDGSVAATDYIDEPVRPLTKRALGRKPTTPSGAVAKAQREKAVKDSPLKDPNAKRRNATTGMVPKSQSGGPTSVGKRNTLENVTKKPRVKSSTNKGKRKLSMDPKQVARRRARGFPSGR